MALEAVCHELGKAQEASKKALLEELKTKTADVDWLLIVLKVLNPSHEMFQPGYVKPKKATHKQCMDNERLQAYNGVFDKLPKAKITRSSKRANIVGKLGKGK